MRVSKKNKKKDGRFAQTCVIRVDGVRLLAEGNSGALKVYEEGLIQGYFGMKNIGIRKRA